LLDKTDRILNLFRLGVWKFSIIFVEYINHEII
jgi:hypothetical protein